MAEAPSNGNQDPAGGAGGTPPAAGGTPPANNGTPPQGGDADLDLSKLEPDQLAKVLENPNLWNLPRIKELRDSAAEAKKLKDERSKADEKALEEQNKWKELAEQRGQKVGEFEQQVQNMQIDQALTNKLVPEGVVDLEAALKLADRSKVTVQDGSVNGVEDVISALKTDKAYLFGKPGQPKVGGPTNPESQPSGPAKFKRSQLRDPAFYQEHRTEILEAQKQGLIEDDITGK